MNFDKSILKQFFVSLNDFLLNVELLRRCSFFRFYFDEPILLFVLYLRGTCWILNFLECWELIALIDLGYTLCLLRCDRRITDLFGRLVGILIGIEQLIFLILTGWLGFFVYYRDDRLLLISLRWLFIIVI